MVQRARLLRKNATIAERLLWARLRLLKQQGFHFRRQAPIGDFVVDFVCHNARLVVEVDGSQHGERVGLAHDASRTEYLNAQGYRVVRFWNANVMRDAVAVAEAIYAEAKLNQGKRS